MGEPKSKFYEWMSKFTRPSDSITDQQVDILIEAPGVYFPKEIKDKVKFYIKKNWATRPGKKSAFALFREASHPCTYEYMNKFINGDQVNGSFLERLKEKTKFIDELDRSNPDEKKMYDESMRSIEVQYEELSKFFTEGYFLHLKNNLIFKNGMPIAVKEGSDRDRAAQCHEKLTEDDYERSSKKIGPDNESLGLMAKYSGGRKRRTRKHKRSKRKTRKYNK